MLSKKTKYAIKALTALARYYGKGPTLISTLAEDERIPKKFLEVILLELRNQGILGSKKGAGGGYYLMKEPAEVTLSQVIRYTDGPIALVPCVSINYYEPCDDCVNETTCGIRNVMADVRDSMLKVLSETSLADILERETQLGAKRDV